MSGDNVQHIGPSVDDDLDPSGKSRYSPPSGWAAPSILTFLASLLALFGVIALIVIVSVMLARVDVVEDNVASAASAAAASIVASAVSAASASKSPPPPPPPPPPPWAGPPGDLVYAESTAFEVGKLLDFYPPDSRSRASAYFQDMSDNWWRQVVYQSISYLSYKLAFLTSFYEQYQQMMLPMDNIAFNVTFLTDATPITRNGHSLVGRKVMFSTYLVGQAGSASQTAKKLAKVGGNITIPWKLPIDPFLTMQLTGAACLDEDQFTHNSIDPENVAVYYDDTCLPGDAVPLSVPCFGQIIGCHCSISANLSCVDAIKQYVGITHVHVTFTRVAWDESLAQYYESLNSYQMDPTAVGGDLVGYLPGLEHNWAVYAYYDAATCEYSEQTATVGWNRQERFDSIHFNQGKGDVFIGYIPYETANSSTFDQAAWNNMIYWALCHQHPHFAEYCSYYVTSAKKGPFMGHKQGFCIQATNRINNGRNSSFVSPYQNCSLQGVNPGWADNYNGGVSGQWVVVTTLDTSSGAVTAQLQMVGNPEQWLCEGVVQTYPNGSAKWVYSGSETTTPPWPAPGLPIDIYKCVYSPGALLNNNDTTSVSIPEPGQGLLTSTCLQPGQIYGPLRDCELRAQSMLLPCATPRLNVTVSMQCSIPHGANSQVLRVCESSVVLGTGTACRYNDPWMLANVVVTPGESTTVQFTCPAARDAPGETGGYYSLYSGAVFNNVDSSVGVTCTGAASVAA